MTHLGSWISALVDGQLDAAATERALAHVARCPLCAGELAAARAARRALAAADEVRPTDDLTARLLSLCAQEPAVPPGPAARDPFAVPASGSPHRGQALPRDATHALRGDVVGRRASRRLVLGSVAGVGAVAAMLFALGARPAVAPSSHPAAVLGLLAADGRDAGTDAVPVSPDSVTWLRGHGWTFPRELPADWRVRAIRWSGDDRRVLEVELDAPSGTVVVTEQQGRLDTAALAGAPVRTVGGRQVHVLSTEPLLVAWQSESTVVQVVGPEDDEDVDAIVGAFPAGGYDDTVVGRIGRGWQTVTSTLEAP
ncbi:zf-HC2 domain-containing protein [Cellulomonas shaoxiangyii]|uniref:Zf-HC2 domain-containing protein n=1 Tax=Cellulomonas shaoxiangyii TaxID=2566013 RepID=A0A4P7SJ98_9CELL|nr:zf-HC2 domain-containing protein [Cellulomonas shaoxiangyii]QCB94339.1 zf-HC2 domain-containing protein [Cellulomonas shaoxiangyii]TGY85178.1 zf-HC2 domain-containing protein [Cellulomonas shaoxiangyii]